MKSLIVYVLVAASLLSYQSVQAQENIVKATPIGIFIQTGDGLNTAGFGLGFGFEHAFSDVITGQINLGGSFKGGGFFSDNRFLIKPEFAIYVMDQALYDLYLGGFVTFGLGGLGGTFIAIGPQAGYQFFFLDDRLAVDINLEVGLGMYAGFGGTNFGFHAFPGASVGYAF